LQQKKPNFRRVSFPAPLFNPAMKSRNETRKSGSSYHYTDTPGTVVSTDLLITQPLQELWCPLTFSLHSHSGNCGVHWPSHGRGWGY